MVRGLGYRPTSRQPGLKAQPARTDGTHVLPGLGVGRYWVLITCMHALPVLRGMCLLLPPRAPRSHRSGLSVGQKQPPNWRRDTFHIEGTHQWYQPQVELFFSGRHLWKDNDGGLVGEYFENSYFQGEPKITRVDAVLNFTWGEGAITRLGTDFISVRWHGKILPEHSTGDMEYNFHMLADDNVRLWIDGDMIIDTWDCADVRFPYKAHSYMALSAPRRHSTKCHLVTKPLESSPSKEVTTTT